MVEYLKKLMVISLLVMISLSTLCAQTKEKKNIFGILAGGTFSSISDYEGETRLGVIGGLYWDWKFSENFSLMSNILYSQRGEKGKNNLSNLKLDYLNMPVVIKYKLSENLGISTGINWDALLSVDGEGVDKDDFKKSDWGIPVGISYDICNNIQLGAMYNIGLTSIAKNNTSNNNLKNNWGSLSIAYLFK